MRFRDLRLHSIIALILILAYAVFGGFYFLTTNGVVSASALSQAQTFWEAKTTSADTQIGYYEGIASVGKENEAIVYIETPVENYHDYFSGKQHLIAPLNTFDPFGTSKYFLFVVSPQGLGYVGLENVFVSYNADETYYLFNQLGEVTATNKQGFTSQTILDYFPMEVNAFGSYLEEVKDGYVVSQEYEGLFFAYHVSKYGNTLGTEKLQEQTLLTLTIGFGVLVAAFFVVLLGFRRASRLVLIDKHNYNKAKSIVIRIDKKGNVVFVNKVFKALFNYEVKLKNIMEFETVGDSTIIQCIKKELNFMAIYKYREEIYYFNFASIYSRGSFYLIGFDDTKQYINNQYLLQMLSKNTLTNLDNALSLTANFMDILEMAKEQLVSMAMINIVGFRDINKVFGRRIGDQCLISFANLLQETFVGMKIFHMDADTFCIIFHDSSERIAQNLCNQLIYKLKTPLLVQNNHIFIRAKAGIFHLDATNTVNLTLEDARNKMEISLRRAMDTATKSIIIYDSNIENYINESNKMEQDLLRAIDKGEFEMYYQPQFNLKTNQIVSFEALIRWNNPLYFRMSPQTFIELAEHNGFILDIGKFVIQESFKVAKRLESYGCHVSINVSPAQFLQAGFVSEIITEFNKNELKPGSISIEITETFVMENFDVMMEKLESLKRQGFGIHLDDFGTGYSSLLYLRELPVSILKIDKEFTKHIESDKYSLTMVEHICNIGRDLNLDIICEGVETEKQRELLKKMGCNIIQGWLIGKAMPIDKALELIHKLNVSPAPTKKTVKRGK